MQSLAIALLAGCELRRGIGTFCIQPAHANPAGHLAEIDGKPDNDAPILRLDEIPNGRARCACDTLPCSRPSV